MVVANASNAARKKARDRAAEVYDAEDAERRRVESERRKRVLECAATIAGNDAETGQLTGRIEELRADTGRQLAAIVADGVSEAQAAAMTGREVREVKAAVKATAAADRKPPKKKPATTRGAVAEPVAA